MTGKRILSLILLIICGTRTFAGPAGPRGYYRQPAIHKDTLVFVSEGDLWKVSARGGVATRLTSHPGEESLPAISPDGQTLAFSAQFEGSAELYTMPLTGGRPQRWTVGGGNISFIGWTPDGRVLYATDRYATLPATQLVVLDVSGKNAGRHELVRLAQAAQGSYDGTGKTLFFTRLPFQGSHTKRYKGGTAQNLWKYSEGDEEAVPLTASYKGTSKNPLWWRERVYFASDRDGTMNLWSMGAKGDDLKQHTRHMGWDVASPAMSSGKIVYQLGADLHLTDLAAGTDRLIAITLESDLDQTREHWIKKPIDYLTAVHISPHGKRVAITARGRVFVAPLGPGRFVEVTRKEGVRYRNARFLPDGKSLVALADESDEIELWKLPANGVGATEQLTRDGEVLRWEGVPSPDGKRIAHRDKNQRLFLYDMATKQNRKIAESKIDDFTDLRWSPDSRWLAYVEPAGNAFRQIKLYRVADGTITPLTTDRFDSYSPAWAPDGQWLYFLSDRNLKTLVLSPWGNYQPEPFLDKKTRIYHIPLTEGLRSPFAPPTELDPKRSDDSKQTKPAKKDGMIVKIDLEDIQKRLIAVPVPPGNYSDLEVNDKTLFWLSSSTGGGKKSLSAATIALENVEVKTVVPDVHRYELSLDGKKVLVHKGDSLYLLDSVAASADLARKAVDLSPWSLSVKPREEWKQMFVEAWRLERDYFYDRGMHGVDWKAIRRKYEPLVERVQGRAELSDLVAQMVSELSALHIFVRGGDLRSGPDRVLPASLGAVLVRDVTAGGYRVQRLYHADPDEPERAGPLTRPGVNVKEGDVIETINGRPALSAPELGLLLRRKAGQQVLLRVKPRGRAAGREVIVKPITDQADSDLRYHDWEHSRRLQVEEKGKGDLGYVHLRAMGGANYNEWARNFYPIFTRKGLILDVRNNRGGNIDSWILNRLMRRAWFYWSQRVGRAPTWNMQYAFRGHVVVLCNETTASDGEAFCEGIKRLGIGKVIGTRTWGGEIWLSANNFLVDKGIATSAEYGVFGPRGSWLIEGHGVDPDLVVDNLPHTTYMGKDAQLDAAIAYLQKRIKEQPVELPPVPPYPKKTLR